MERHNTGTRMRRRMMTYVCFMTVENVLSRDGLLELRPWYYGEVLLNCEIFENMSRALIGLLCQARRKTLLSPASRL